MFKIRLFTFTTCVTLSGVVLPALALELSNPFNYPTSSLDRPGINLNKTRPEFTQPDLPTASPYISLPLNSSPSPASSPRNNSSPEPTSSSPRSSPLVPLVSPNLIPMNGTGAQGFGDRPITPNINNLPGTNRPEFQVPDLIRPGVSPSPSPTPRPSP